MDDISRNFNVCTWYDLGADSAVHNLNSLKGKINCIHLNIRSINRNIDRFMADLGVMGVHWSVIVLTETWLDSESDFNHIPGYRAYHSVRKNKKGGGVTVLVDLNLKSECISEFTFSRDIFETACVKIFYCNDEYTILGTYRPPSSSLKVFNETYPEILSNIGVGQKIIILGDFNVDIGTRLIGESSVFMNNFVSFNYKSLIDIPTRVSDISQTCIDHIYSNFPEYFLSGVVNTDVTDHFPIFCSVLPRSIKNDAIRISFRDHSSMNLNNFEAELALELGYFHLYESLDVNSQFYILDNILNRVYNSTCPNKTKYVSKKYEPTPWLTDSIRGCVKEKHRLYRLSKRNPVYRDQYKYYSKYLDRMIKNAKISYNENLFGQCSRDSKQTWNKINYILNGNIRKSDDILLSNGDVLHSKEDSATVFNEYFSQMAGNVLNKLPPAAIDPLGLLHHNPYSFWFLEITPGEICKIVDSLKIKKSGADKVPSFLIKRVCSLLAPVLSAIFNNCVKKSVFPDVFKTARVIPIHKKNSKFMPSNYRPVSTLPFISKIFERSMLKRLTRFFNKHDLLYKNQFGFLKNKSTTDAVLNFVHSCLGSFEEKTYMISAFLDISRAFDTISHKILLGKLERYGIRGFVLRWIESYLSGRKQYVNVNGSHSNCVSMPHGVPQGSILGPFLFIVYLNDFHRSTRLSVIHYADDSTLYATSSNLENLVEYFNGELHHINSWLTSNKLLLNASKSNYTIFTNKCITNYPIISIDGCQISFTAIADFLGIMIDNKLDFSEHISRVCNRISRVSGILWRLSYLPKSVLRKIYLSLASPHLFYGIELWGNTYQVHIKPLQSLLKRCMKSIYHRNGPLVNTKIMSFNQIYQYACLLRFYKYYRLKISDSFSVLFSSQEPNHGYRTRFMHNEELNTPRFHSSKFLKSFSYNSVKFWNELPLDIKHSDNLPIFKRRIREFILR